MKKKRILLFVIAVFFVLTSAFAVLADSNPNTRNLLDWNNNPWPDFDEVLNQNGVKVNEKEEMIIPVYYETDLLFETEGMYYLNRDAAFYSGLNSRPNDASEILAAYPTDALRVRADQSSYAVYETDKGSRFYLFFDTDKGATTVGYPIVINKLLSYTDFNDINVGDTIDDVAVVDDVTELYKRTFFDVWQLDYKGAKSLSELGHPCVTLHYLKDGILKIEYEMQEDQSLVVSKIIFNEEFKLECADGKIVDHKIEDVDLPTN